MDELADKLAAVRARWPAAPAVGDDLVAFVRARGASPDRLADLFLAWWASTGDDAGIAAFEATFHADLDRLVARFRTLPGDELRQRLRIKLFVGDAPKIRDYRGTGPLGGWLRVTAARLFVDAARADSRRSEVDLDEADVLGIGVSEARDAHQRAELTSAIKAAFADAISKLEPRERTFLRHVTVDDLTLEHIATTYKLHRATVARTLKAARERLLADTRAGVIARLGIKADELDSALVVLDSKLDLSLATVLGESSTMEA